jgi:hypothetical protein
MSTSNVRAFIAISMVLVFIGLTLFMALFPLLSSKGVEIPDYADYFLKIVSVYTGILGVIVGYYFARVEGSKQTPDAAGPSASQDSKTV